VSAARSLPDTPPIWRSLLRSVLFIALGFIIAYPLARGWAFYRASADARVDHVDYRLLAPGAYVGHGYGIVGTGLILTNLLYLARRRLPWLPMGSLAAWLDIHVVTGIGGSILILYHSAFQLRTPIASMTSVSLLVVVVTGLVGRYIYELTPRTGEQTLKERLAELDLQVPSFSKSVREVLDKTPATTLPQNASVIRVFLTIPIWILQARRRRKIIFAIAKRDQLLVHLRKSGEKRFAKWIAKDIATLWAGDVGRIAGGSVLRLWRGLHRIMAILMVLSVGIHIGVAWYFGYRWIFAKP
jgi:hypothetical protein